MYKTLTIAALLLAAFAFHIGRSADASPVTPVSAPIVAKGKVVSQTAEIPQTSIFTPSATGLYRLSAYMVEMAPGSTPNIYWNFNLFWTDDGGSEVNPGNMLLAAVGGFGTPT